MQPANRSLRPTSYARLSWRAWTPTRFSLRRSCASNGSNKNLTTKSLRKQLILGKATSSHPGKDEHGKDKDWVFRFGLQLHTTARVHRGTLLISCRQGKDVAFCIWHQRGFLPPKDERTMRWVHGDVLFYSINQKVRVRRCNTLVSTC